MDNAVPYNSSNLPFYTHNDTMAGDSLVSPTVSAGYDIRAVRISEARRQAALARANGSLSNSREKVVFFVKKVTEDTGIVGQTAQGRRTRDFYPHNIEMPSLTIIAQVLDQQDYATVVEFVHTMQQEAVGNVRAGNLMQFDLNGPTSGLGNFHRRGEGSVTTMKGRHKPICAQGFVESIDRKHGKDEFAPIFQFTFLMAHEFDGIATDVASYEVEQESWWEVLNGLKKFVNQRPEKPEPKTQPEPNRLPTGEDLHNAGF